MLSQSTVRVMLSNRRRASIARSLPALWVIAALVLVAAHARTHADGLFGSPELGVGPADNSVESVESASCALCATLHSLSGTALTAATRAPEPPPAERLARLAGAPDVTAACLTCVARGPPGRLS